MGRALLFAGAYLLLALVAVSLTAFVQFRGNFALSWLACTAETDATTILAMQARAVIAFAVLSLGPLLIVRRFVPALTRNALAPVLLGALAVFTEAGVRLTTDSTLPASCAEEIGSVLTAAAFSEITTFLFIAAVAAHGLIAWRGGRAILRAHG